MQSEFIEKCDELTAKLNKLEVSNEDACSSQTLSKQ